MRFNIYNKKTLRIFCTLVIISIIFPYCTLRITNVEQPSTAVAGEVINVKIDANTNVVGGDFNAAYVLGILAPKGWKVAENAEVSYVSTKGNAKMRLMEDDRIDPAKENVDGPNLTYKAWWRQKFGLGGNLLDDMEWVFFEGEEVYFWGNGEIISGSINIKLKVGMDGNNTLVKLGYGICNSRDGSWNGATGPTWATYFGSCFEVTGGTTGETVDFCNPQLTNITPGKVTDNDLVTFTFDGNVLPTQLTGKKPLYLCATGIVVDNATNAETSVEVCERTPKTALKEISENRHAITIWPVDFFKLTESQTLRKVSYFITDDTGTIKVGYNNTAEPFSLVLKCE